MATVKSNVRISADARKKANREFLAAADACSLDGMKKAIEMGADPNAKDRWAADLTALHKLAGKSGAAECIAYLRTVPGINVNARDRYKATPLMDAASHNQLENVIELKKFPNLDPNAQDRDLTTAYHFAIVNKFDKVAAELRAIGAKTPFELMQIRGGAVTEEAEVSSGTLEF